MPDATQVEGEEKGSAEDAQLAIAEQNAKLAEKLEETAARVASIAEAVAERPAAQPQPAAQPAAPQRLTEDQVMALVEDKKITMAQGMAYLRKLAAEDARMEARRETAAALAEVGQAATAQQVVSAIAEYKKAVPALAQRHSNEWNEVAQRYQQLVGEGYPATVQTELQALRELYGRDPSKPRDQQPVRDRTKERAMRGAETPSGSSSRGAPSRRGRASSEPDPELGADHRTYVDHMISIGQFKGWDDPKAQKYVARAKSIAERKRGAA